MPTVRDRAALVANRVYVHVLAGRSRDRALKFAYVNPLGGLAFRDCYSP